MHITNPDLVAIKTAIRHLASRVEAEVSEAEHWSSLAGNRGVGDVSATLDSVAETLRNAHADLDAAARLLFDAQEQQSSQAHDHPHQH
ncbi:MAG: hypothetical protein KKB90_04440 [Actinobacteria bacterium]|nr:hypothetical protein [Actinomycetota bacterium]MCG2818616.1 hypothetical protein [Actinomycetes bacterium]MBU4178782.1 hypothetical protein [Actinomycetota bacterium]MBU4218195.1 hypothetical protein [Actinomycetota bacterium]MBU4358620.1 hypothetical protein [Actinomycetota bacterium]